MALVKLSKSVIDKLPLPPPGPGDKATQILYRDESLPCFGLRVGSGGTKAFFVERRIGGRVKRISIGRYGHLTPQQARQKAQELLGEIALGGDPSVKRKGPQIEGKELTLQQTLDDYLRTRKGLAPGTIKNYRACIKNNLPDWANRRLIEITKDDVENRHLRIGANCPTAANNTMKLLRSLFNHAKAKYEDSQGNSIFIANPVDRISSSRAWYKQQRKRSLLLPHELGPWYQATLTLAQDATRDYLHFLLFTGLRKMEAATLTWDDIDFKAGLLTVTKTKNGEPHTLPLTDHLLTILQQRKQATPNSPWVFTSPWRNRNRHISEPQKAVARVGKLSGKEFTLHDLRRTFITIAESLDIPAYALKQLLNHKSAGDVTMGYIVVTADRLREPMNKISSFIFAHTHKDMEA